MESVQEEDKAKKKITHLLLNSPGACFLCLQDSDRDDEGDPVENLNGGTINLSTICRYLNINQCSLLLTSLKSDGGVAGLEDLEQHSCTFSVNLCRQCLELTTKLNEIINQLEITKLMANYHLHSFHKVLEVNKKAERGEWMTDLQDRMNTNLENSLEAKLVRLLREEAKKKSFKILRKAEAAMPQLILSKCQTPAPPPPLRTNYHPPPFLEPPSAPSINLGSSPSIKTLISHLVTSNEIPSKSHSPSPQSRLYRCPYCIKIMGHSKFALHLSCLHSDKLLSSHFLPPSLPPSEQICKEVLHSKVVGNSVKIRSSSTPTAPPRLACHLCGITYSDGNLLKHHFLITHTNQLCEEIINFEEIPQKSNKVEKLAKSQVSKSVNQHIKQLLETCLINCTKDDKDNTDNAKVIKRYQCPFCGILNAQSKFALHLANIHPDMLLDPFTPSIDKHKDDNPNYFIELCTKVLASQVAQATKTPGPSSSMSSKLCCHLCASKYSDGRHLKHHFVVHHTDNLVEQLIKIGNMKEGGGVQDKQNGKTDKQLKLKRIRKPGKDERDCLICRQTFSKYDKLQRHLLTRHPDQLFLECKPSWMRIDQFRGKIKEFFKCEVGKATYGKPGDKLYKCGYCPGGKTSYKGSDYLEMHLAYQHQEEMGRKLREDKVEENDNTFSGGDQEEVDWNEEGGDHMVIEEEDATEFDVKPDIEDLDKMLYPDMVLNELISGEEEDKLEQLQQQYGYFQEEDSGGDRQVDDNAMVGNMTDEQLEEPDNQLEPPPPPQPPIIKMEVN